MLALLDLWPFFVLHTLPNSLECPLCFPVFRNLSSKVTKHVCFSPVLAMKVHDPSLYWSFLWLSRNIGRGVCVHGHHIISMDLFEVVPLAEASEPYG